MGALIIFFLSSLNELGIERKVDHRGSWIGIILKSLLISNNVSVRSLFFQTFCKKTLRFFTIMLVCVKIVDGGLYFIFSFHFYFYFSFFIFLFLEQLRLGFISHAVTSVTNWWRSHKTDHRTWENGVEGTRIKWRHTAWTTHAGLM